MTMAHVQLQLGSSLLCWCSPPQWGGLTKLHHQAAPRPWCSPPQWGGLTRMRAVEHTARTKLRTTQPRGRLQCPPSQWDGFTGDQAQCRRPLAASRSRQCDAASRWISATRRHASRRRRCSTASAAVATRTAERSGSCSKARGLRSSKAAGA